MNGLLKSMTHEVAVRATAIECKIRSQYGTDFIAKPYNTTLPPGIRAKSAQKTEVIGRVAYLASPWSANHPDYSCSSSSSSTSSLVSKNDSSTKLSSEETNSKKNLSSSTTTITANGSNNKDAKLSSNITASLLEDMYGIEKSTEPRYFECLNCTRKIAGNRFAAHLDRCLGGRNSRHK